MKKKNQSSKPTIKDLAIEINKAIQIIIQVEQHVMKHISIVADLLNIYVDLNKDTEKFRKHYDKTMKLRKEEHEKSQDKKGHDNSSEKSDKGKKKARVKKEPAS